MASKRADLRALAEELNVLKPCECYGGCERCDCGNRTLGDVCWRLPTEAEVRAAIFGAGVHFLEVSESDAGFAGVRFGGDLNYRVTVDNEEVETGTSVLLALLRALEACRG